MNEPQKEEPKKDNNHRLGIDHSIPGVDKELIEPFAKIIRLIGIIVVIIFVSWGLFSEWGYRRSPFESFVIFVGFPRQDSEVFEWTLAILIFFFGWLSRFIIGNIFVVAVIKLFDFLKGIFRSI